LLIDGSVSIDGPGANRLAVSGNGASRVFEIGGGIFNALSNYDSTGYGQFDPSTLTVTNGFIGFNTSKGGPGSAGLGGGIYSDATASLNLVSSLVSFNQAGPQPIATSIGKADSAHPRCMKAAASFILACGAQAPYSLSRYPG